MNESDQPRAYAIAALLEELARKIRNESFTGGWGHFIEWYVWEKLDELRNQKVQAPPAR